MYKKFIELLLGMGYIDSDTEINKTLFEFYINTAISFVKWYVNKEEYTEEDIEDLFENQTLNIALFMFNDRKNKGIKSKTQGSRSVTFMDYVIPDEYLKSLPRYPHIY